MTEQPPQSYKSMLLRSPVLSKPPEVSADAFNAVRIDVHEFVGFEQRFDLGPDAGEQRVKIISAQIAKP